MTNNQSEDIAAIAAGDRSVLIDCAASLSAAVSILKRSYTLGKPANRVVASDLMFRTMLADYEKSLIRVRAHLNKTDGEKG